MKKLILLVAIGFALSSSLSSCSAEMRHLQTSKIKFK